MRFPDTFLDDIRDRLRISEVVGARVSFDKKKTNAAKGDFWGNCPFHGEKTPSFHCEDRKGRYHCFGCGVSGDHFRFLTELDGLSFPEAVERLADQAGLPMPVMDKREQEREEQRKTLFDVMEIASQYFQDQLQSANGAQARAYLRGRGLSPAIQQEFGIGFAPDSRNALKEYLASKGIDQKQVEACGLVVYGEGIAVSYDRFRGRVMFPIPDARGRVIAFGGRALADDALAKYLNSPETDLFHKSNVLYNFARARKPSYDKKQIIAAEGYMDVIALHAAGFDNAVAPLGTALTERQMELLWRMHGEPVLCFDGDSAGLKAAYRAVDMALPVLQPGRSVRFAMLPDGQDPDDLIKEEGPEAMRDVLENALPLSEMVWNRETSAGIYNTPERRAELESRLRQLVSSIRDESVRRHYGQDIASRLQGYFGNAEPRKGNSARHNNSQSYQSGYQSGSGNYNNTRSVTAGGRRFTASASLLSSRMVKRGHKGMALREAAIIAGIAFHPAVGFEHFEEVSVIALQSNDAKGVLSAILDAFANWSGEEDFPDTDHVVARIEKLGLGEIFAAMRQQLVTSNLWPLLPEAAFEDARDGWLQAYHLYLKNQTLNTELKAAERALADDDSQENLERLLQIQQELTRVDGIEALIDGFGVPSGRAFKTF